MALTSRVRDALRTLMAPSSAIVHSGPISDAPRRLLETKASSVTSLPRGAYGGNYWFFSSDGGRTAVPLDSLTGASVLAFMSYWYSATRWKASKIAEAPLMVIAEDQIDGSSEWIADHPLVPILEEPSPDYDMGELLERTSIYLDNTAIALWTFDKNSAGEIVRITPFCRAEFSVEPDNTRLYATFRVNTAQGSKTFDYEDVAYFRDTMDGWNNMGRSRLDVALSWLRLGEKASRTIYDLLSNAVWPSGIIVPDKDWNPDKPALDFYKEQLQDYAREGNKGKPFVALGGGSFTALQAQIKDLVPEDILNRVESIVSSVTGVPAIVLQFQVGMENSPWSQMAEARKMAYDDVIVPAWRKIERVLTRQMLRPIDEDTTHFIKFDASQVSTLQKDQLTQVQTATLMGKAASLNERRTLMGLEPSDDPKADEIPELTQPSLQDILAGNANNNPSNANDNPPNDNPPPKSKAALQRKFAAPILQQALREESQGQWALTVRHLLKQDADAIARIVEQTLLEEPSKSARRFEIKARGKDQVMSAIAGYFKQTGDKAWARGTTPLMVHAAERSTAVVAADLGITFNQLHPSVLAFSKRETGRMIAQVTKTTQSLVADIVQGGIDAQVSTNTIAKTIREATGFSQSRADTIARTEVTKAFNGGPQESLSAYAQSSGLTFTKEWSGVLDELERDEHVAMEGEVVGIDEEFSNGLLYPSEPNCRCTVLYSSSED